MEYKKLDSTAFEFINKWIKDNKYEGSIYSFCAFIAWFRDYEYCINENTLYLRAYYESDDPVNWAPLTYGSFAEAIKVIPENEAIFFVREEDVNQLDKERYAIKSYPSESEYIYKAKDFVDMVGKKYHGKRNHISKFSTLYPNATLVNYESKYREDVMKFASAWVIDKEVSQDTLVNYDLDEEISRLVQMLDEVEKGNLICAILFVEGKIVGVTIAEIMSSNNAIVMYEKADINYEGSYTYLARTFAKEYLYDCNYINRQEDMGIEGLRKSKLSYNPDHMFVTYAIIDHKYRGELGKVFASPKIEDIKDGYAQLEEDDYDATMEFLERNRQALKDIKFFLNYKPDELEYILTHGFMYARIIDGKIAATCGIDADREYGNMLRDICGGSKEEGQFLEFSGIMVDEKYRKRGYGRDICQKVIEWAKEYIKPCTLCAVVQYNNEPSLNNLKKLGFVERAQKEQGEYNFKYLTLYIGASND